MFLVYIPPQFTDTAFVDKLDAKLAFCPKKVALGAWHSYDGWRTHHGVKLGPLEQIQWLGQKKSQVTLNDSALIAHDGRVWCEGTADAILVELPATEE